MVWLCQRQSQVRHGPLGPSQLCPTEKPKLFPNCTAFPFLAGGRGGLAPSPHAGINLEPIPCVDFSPGGRALGLDAATWVCAPHGLIPQQGCAEGGGEKSCLAPSPWELRAEFLPPGFFSCPCKLYLNYCTVFIRDPPSARRCRGFLWRVGCLSECI